MSSAVKKLKTIMSDSQIGTHNGVFHCDESLGCFLIQQLPKFKEARVVRTRDQAVLDKCEIVLDVGGEYDHDKRRYDHHQKSFTLSLGSIHPSKASFGNIKLSSAGLIYAHYGHEIIAKILGWNKDDINTDLVFDKVYDKFIKEIDGIDNGIEQFEGTPVYTISTNLSSRVAYLKPNWNEDNSDEILYDCFLKAIALTGSEFVDRVKYFGLSWIPARSIVEESFKKRHEVDSSGQIIALDNHCPWIEHLFDIEKQYDQVGSIKFVLFEDGQKWRVRSVPISPDSFILRVPLNEKWCGLRDQELSQISGIPNCVFVHATGFIGGSLTFDGAKQMAIQSLPVQ